jgi:hypothetical protein
MKSPLWWLWYGVIAFAGCSPLDVLPTHWRNLGEEASAEKPTQLVGELTVPFGMFPVRVEAVTLVTGLQGTGSDPPPSPQRAMLLDEMKARGVANPNALLASKNTSLVVVRGVLPPGIQKGDHFDVEIHIPSRSETTSLRGGWLMETRLTELAALPDNRIHSGRLLALAEGPVMVDPSASAKSDRAAFGRGRVLGGGSALKSRDLGLVLKPEHQSVPNSSRVANAINRRLHTYQGGVQVGVAKAKTDQFIELTIHRRYKDNLARYLRVLRAIALQETDTELVQRIARLQDQLLEPATAAEAALQLEAIGSQGVEPLCKALQSHDAEVRFSAAEALAYLDRREAAEPLGQIARDEPAFRVFALTALSVMDDFAAYEQLRNMLDLPSAETRYGAFRALWAMNANDALVAGERLGAQFSYHVLDTAGPPLIHVTHNRRPEIVLFGRHQKFLAPLAVNAGNQIMVTSCGLDEVAVSKFSARGADQKRVVSTHVDDVVRAIVELGGTYPDVVQAIQEAKIAAALPSRFEVDAVPEAGRTYQRAADPNQQENAAADTSEFHGAPPAQPAPDLFSKRVAGEESSRETAAPDAQKKSAEQADSAGKSPGPAGVFAKILGRGSN